MEDSPIVDENLDLICPHCGGPVVFVETEGHDIPSGVWDLPPTRVIDKYVYRCRDCGDFLKSDIDL